jgi:RND family efflux transporter MFP subunit
MRRPSKKVWLPLAILGGGLLVAIGLVLNRPGAQARPHEVVAPLVRAVRAEPQEFRYVVRANGTVMPRTQSDLIPQVSGEVTWVSPALVSGGFFAADEPLLRIDPRDYEAALESARASLARAESERSRARTERGRQRELAQRSVASQTRIDDAENAFRVADAQIREARASLGRAERDLERTELTAPYEGRVREENVDVGQFVNRGTPVARLYAVDAAEVRLPVPDRELSYLDLSLSTGSARYAEPAGADPSEESPSGTASGPEVRLHAEFAGRDRIWHGQIVRTEGEIDPRSRMINVVARVEDPYGSEPPLAVGLFVSAEILGRREPRAYVLPRAAIREEESGFQVLLIDAEDRIRFRPVEVLRSEADRVVIGSGLSPGERVCVSPLGAVVEGMKVRVIEGDRSDSARDGT